MRALAFVLAIGLVGCASLPQLGPPPATVDEVVAAERDFARRGQEIGWVGAFLEFSSTEGKLIFGDRLTPTAEGLAAAPKGDRSLYWWPAFAGIARSGDLGFTTGGFSTDPGRTPAGQYFTVWRRESDGSWKWIYDGGPGRVTDPAPLAAGDAGIESLPVASGGAGKNAVFQVTALEQQITDPAKLAAHLAPDAHVYRRAHARAIGNAAARANLDHPSPQASYRLVRLDASTAGDLAVALGQVTWTQNGQPRTGSYARVWQHRDKAWLVVYDQIVERPPAAQ